MSKSPESSGVSGSSVGVESLRDSLLPLWNPAFEVCGLVLKDGAIYAIKNIHDDAHNSFQFCIDDLETFCDEYRYEDVLGVYHSHPSGNPLPSSRDVSGWPKGGDLRYFIVTRDSITEWKKDYDGSTALVASAE